MQSSKEQQEEIRKPNYQANDICLDFYHGSTSLLSNTLVLVRINLTTGISNTAKSQQCSTLATYFLLTYSLSRDGKRERGHLLHEVIQGLRLIMQSFPSSAYGFHSHNEYFLSIQPKTKRAKKRLYDQAWKWQFLIPPAIHWPDVKHPITFNCKRG